METTKSIIRAIILISLFTVAVYLIFSEPAEDSKTWISDFIISKASGFICAIAFVKLRKTWISKKTKISR